MKIYFDTLTPNESNLLDLQSYGDNNFWLVSRGTVLKKQLSDMNFEIELLSKVSDPGCYFIDVNADPKWWSGMCEGLDVPTKHVLSCIPSELINLIKNKKIRIIIAADKEGGSMNISNQNAFLSTTNAMIEIGLPAGSVLIIQGNFKIKEDYEKWLKNNNVPKMFEVQYSSHFTELFFNKDNLPSETSIDSSVEHAKFDFNSLNRVYRSHRGSHCYYLAKNKLLDNGIVSCNSISLTDHAGAETVNASIEQFSHILKTYYPRFVDGDWSNTNAAGFHNHEFYKNSLITFVTETKFDEDVVFPTEKIYKPIVFGHPLIVLASAGTLRAIQELGFKIDWCGIDPSYNDIVNHRERFLKTHKILRWWIDLPRKEKVNRILRSRETIEHNFHLIRTKNFYQESLTQAIQDTKEYFKNES
jgi:hypothetical protein